MARNGSGTYSRVEGPYVYNTIIDQVEINAELDDIATALTNSLTKNGETTATANQPMGTYRHTGVGNGVARTDYAATGQVQDGTLNWVDGGGTADAITATYSPAITALVDGQICCVRATAANATTTPTFAPNGLTARTIVKTGGVALVAGDIVGDGHELILRYLLASTRWELLNPAINAANALLAGSASQAFAASTVTATTFIGALTGNADTATKSGIPQNSQSAAYTTVLADGNKHLLHPTADNNARTFTIDSNANVAYAIGTTLTFVNQINTLTIAIASDTLTLAGIGTTGSRTLNSSGMATAIKVEATKWVISGSGLS